MKLAPDTILQKERTPFSWSLFRDERTLTASELDKQQKVFFLAICFVYADLKRRSPPNSLYLWSTELDSIDNMVTQAIGNRSDADIDIEKYMSSAGLKTASIYFRFPIFRLSVATYKPVRGERRIYSKPSLDCFSCFHNHLKPSPIIAMQNKRILKPIVVSGIAALVLTIIT